MKLADTAAVAFMVSRQPATIRSWAHKHGLTRYGTPQRALYDVDEVLACCARRDAANPRRPLDNHQSHPPR